MGHLKIHGCWFQFFLKNRVYLVLFASNKPKEKIIFWMFMIKKSIQVWKMMIWETQLFCYQFSFCWVVDLLRTTHILVLCAILLGTHDEILLLRNKTTNHLGMTRETVIKNLILSSLLLKQSTILVQLEYSPIYISNSPLVKTLQEYIWEHCS